MKRVLISCSNVLVADFYGVKLVVEDAKNKNPPSIHLFCNEKGLPCLFREEKRG